MKPCVLLVDDVEANLVALDALLRRLDCETVRARSGNDALRLLLEREFAVVLLDVHMPRMDGFEVARLARANPVTKDIPIIYVTAVNDDENALQGYDVGAVDFLFKPVNPVVLRSKVQVFLDLFNQRAHLQSEIAARREAQAELEAFNYSVSHDLRAPLRSVNSFAHILKEDFAAALPAEAKDCVERIHAASVRMSELIDDLLRLSSISRAQMTVAPVDLAPVAAEIIDELERSEPSRQLSFINAPHANASCDLRLLRIVLENLLRNAWKFTRKQAMPIIEFGCDTADGKTTYFVRDNGDGFDPAYGDKLFRPFQRLHSSAEFEGTGIGLAIVGRIIARHGGQVRAEGRPGLGATIRFSLGQ